MEEAEAEEVKWAGSRANDIPKIRAMMERKLDEIVVANGQGRPEGSEVGPEVRSGVINHPFFDQFILGFIMINTVALAMEHHDREQCIPMQQAKFDTYGCTSCNTSLQVEELCQSPSFIAGMAVANYVFNFVFTVECVLKICGMGFSEYIKLAFNKLDFFIVVTSSFDMIGEAMAEPGAEAGGPSIFKLFRVFRLFRVLRVARILYRNENLKRVRPTAGDRAIAMGAPNACQLCEPLTSTGAPFTTSHHPVSGADHGLRLRRSADQPDSIHPVLGPALLHPWHAPPERAVHSDQPDRRQPDGHKQRQPLGRADWRRPVRHPKGGCGGALRLRHRRLHQEGPDPAAEFRGLRQGLPALFPDHDWRRLGAPFDKTGWSARLASHSGPWQHAEGFSIWVGGRGGGVQVNQMHDYLEVRPGWITWFIFFANFGFCNFILLR